MMNNIRNKLKDILRSDIRDIWQNPYFILRAPPWKCSFRLSSTKGEESDSIPTIPFALLTDWNLRMHTLEGFIEHR